MYHNNTKYYNILGVSPGSSNEDIKRAYRKLALQWHPDRNKTPEAEGKFKEIGEAYEILTTSSQNKPNINPNMNTNMPFKNPNMPFKNPHDLFTSLFGQNVFQNVHTNTMPININIIRTNGFNTYVPGVTSKQVQTTINGDNKIETITETGGGRIKRRQIITNLSTGKKTIIDS